MAFMVFIGEKVPWTWRVSNLKDQYFLPATIEKLGADIETIHPDFLSKRFSETVLSDPWDSLELMDRMRRVADCLRKFLPEDYRDALRILRSVASEVEGFDSLIFPDFVQRYGLDYPDESIPALEHFTELCSSEFAVRPYIVRYPDRMWQQLETWARSDNVHHRRLASEGCRPRLPWASALKALKKDPSPFFLFLRF